MYILLTDEYNLYLNISLVMNMSVYPCMCVCVCVCMYVLRHVLRLACVCVCVCVCKCGCAYMIIQVILTLQYISSYCGRTEHRFLIVRIQNMYYNMTNRWQLGIALIFCYNLKHTNKMAVCVCVCVCVMWDSEHKEKLKYERKEYRLDLWNL